MAAEKPITIYHNPRCGKSRDTLAILQKRGVEPEIVEYLKTPPTREDLRGILKKLGMKPEQIVRKGEDVFKQKFAGKGPCRAEQVPSAQADGCDPGVGP